MKAAFHKRLDIVKALLSDDLCEPYAVNCLGQSFLDYSELDSSFFEAVTAVMNEN